MMDKIMHEVDPNSPYLIFTFMHTTVTNKRGSPFPFANLLPFIFAHFNINLEDKEKEKVETSKPPPFTDENFESLCEGLEEMHIEWGLLSMLAKARFKKHIKAFKHTLRWL